MLLNNFLLRPDRYWHLQVWLRVTPLRLIRGRHPQILFEKFEVRFTAWRLKRSALYCHGKLLASLELNFWKLSNSARKHYVPIITSGSVLNVCHRSRIRVGQFCSQKVDDASALEHGPINHCSLVIQLYHKNSDARLERAVDFSPYQNGLGKVNRVGANLFTLRNLFDNARKLTKMLTICFVGLQKAFDSVAHESLRKAMRAKNIPSKLVLYVTSVNKGATT